MQPHLSPYTICLCKDAVVEPPKSPASFSSRWDDGFTSPVRCSVIPNAGQGLFATRNFTKGDLLGVYRGRVLYLLQAHQLEDRDYLIGGFG